MKSKHAIAGIALAALCASFSAQAEPLSAELAAFASGMGKVAAVAVPPEKDPASLQAAFEKAGAKTGLERQSVSAAVAEAAQSATWTMSELPFSHWVVAKSADKSACMVSGDPSIEKRPASSRQDMEKRGNELKSVFSCLTAADPSFSDAYGQALMADMDKANKAVDAAAMAFTASVLLADGRDKAQAALADPAFVDAAVKSYGAGDAEAKKSVEAAKRIIWMAGWGEAGKSKIMQAVMKKLKTDLAAISAQASR